MEYNIFLDCLCFILSDSEPFEELKDYIKEAEWFLSKKHQIKTQFQTDRILYPCFQMPRTFFFMCSVTESRFPEAATIFS